MAVFADFEGGIAGWTVDGSATLSAETVTVHSGTTALSVVTPDTTLSKVFSPVFSLSHGWYKVSAWVYGDENSYIYMSMSPGQNRNYHHVQPMAWTLVTDYYYVSTDTASLSIDFSVYNGYDFIIDDIEIEPISSVTESFEGSIVPYPFIYNGLLSSTYAHSGTQSLESFNDTWPNGIVINAPAKAGFDCTITLWAYSPAGSDHAKLGYVSWVTGTEFSDETTSHDVWQQLSVTIPAQEVVWDTPWEGAVGPTAGTGPIYIDDVEITFAPVDNAYVHNSNFDDFADGDIYGADPSPSYYWWKATDTETAEIVSDFSHSGAKSMHVVLPASNQAMLTGSEAWLRPSLGMYAEISWAQTGADYEISAWVYVPTGSAPVSLVLIREQEVNKTIYRSAASTTFDTWEKLTIYGLSQYDFEYTAYYDTYLYTLTDDAEAEFWIDDLSIEQQSQSQAVLVDVRLVGTLSTDHPSVSGSTSAVVEMSVDSGFTPAASSIDVPVGLTATAAWGGSAPKASSTLTVSVDARASRYIDKTFDDLNTSIGGYWQATGGYGNAYVGFSQLSQSNVFSLAGHDYCLRWDHAANTNGSMTFLSSEAFGTEPFYAGLTYQYAVDVYVPSGYPAVKLAAYTGIPQKWSYFGPPDAIPRPTETVAVTSTVFDAWQRLTITLPASNNFTEWSLKMLSTNQAVASRWHIDNATWRYYGVLDDPLWVTSEPNPYGDDGWYRSISTGTVLGHYQQYAPNPSTNSVLQSTIARSGQAWHLTTEANGSDYTGGALVYVEDVQRLYGAAGEGSVTLKLGAWVYVPSGQPRVMIGCSVSYYLNAPPYDQHWHDIAVPSYSTTWDQWEYIETDLSWTYSYNPSGDIYVDGWYGAQVTPYIAADDPGNLLGSDFYLDDFAIGPYPISPGVDTTMLVQSTAYGPDQPVKRYTALVDVDMTGTLVDLTIRAEGSVSVDIGMDVFRPFTAPVSSSIDFPVRMDKALSLRTNYKSTLFPATSNWEKYGFEANQYTDSYEGGDWDWDAHGSGSYHPDSDLYYQIGGWQEPGGGQGGSARSLMVKNYPRNENRYEYIERWTVEYRPGFDLMAHVWVYSSNPVPFLFVAHNNYDDDVNGFNRELARAQSTKVNEWEKVMVVVPWNASVLFQTSNFPKRLSFAVYSTGLQMDSPVCYLDNFDAFLVAPAESTIRPAVSI